MSGADGVADRLAIRAGEHWSTRSSLSRQVALPHSPLRPVGPSRAGFGAASRKLVKLRSLDRDLRNGRVRLRYASS
jgi:hypothetical protein